MKKFLPAILITFSFSFMLFIFEPLTMYANNINDFWFDIYILLKPTLILFFVAFVSILAFFYLIFLLCKKIIKSYSLFNIFLIVFSIIFIVTYIQGNYLSYNLPRLNGETIRWSKYTTDKIISYILLIVVSAATLLLAYRPKIKTVIKNRLLNLNIIIKDNSQKVTKVLSFVSVVIFVMLLTALVPTLLKEKVFIKKYLNATSSIKNYSVVSTNKNFFIVVVDSVDSKIFYNELKNSKEFKNLFEDFTYYPDTMSMYGYTRNSVPLILSGILNDNKMDFIDYSNYAFDNSKLFKNLDENGFDINIYDYDITWNGKKTQNIKNFVKLDRKVNSINGFNKQLMKYIKFKYLPFYLKNESNIETLDFNKTRVKKKIDYFYWHDWYNYNILKKNEVEKVSNNHFAFYRFEGAHELFNTDENLNLIENGTYEQKVRATIKLIDSFIKRLKKNGLYDNSVIIVMADHGYNADSVLKRNNPILLIKGYNEHHGMITSNIKISHSDLENIYEQLLNEKLSSEIIVDSNKKRKYLYYDYGKENRLIEYETSGHAWEYKKLVKTGKEYNR